MGRDHINFMSNGSSDNKEYLTVLTSLRFFAAAAIVAHHSIYPLLHIPQGSLGISLERGVSFFFVLSGFILTWNYPKLIGWSEKKKYYLARIARIYPAHVFTAALFIFLSFIEQGPGYLAGKALLWFSNLTLIHGLIPNSQFYLSSINPVSWSISVEMLCYALFPFIISRDRKQIASLIIICTFLLFSIVWMGSKIESLPEQRNFGEWIRYYGPLIRFVEFYAGILLCLAYKRLSILRCLASNNLFFSLLEVTAVLFILFAFTLDRTSSLKNILDHAGENQFQLNLVYVLENLLGAALFSAAILIFAFGKGWISNLLRHSAFLYLGEISFSLYLVHFMIISNLLMTPQWRWTVNSAPIVTYVVYWLVCLLLSAGIYHFVERPARRAIIALPIKVRAVIKKQASSTLVE